MEESPQDQTGIPPTPPTPPVSQTEPISPVSTPVLSQEKPKKPQLGRWLGLVLLLIIIAAASAFALSRHHKTITVASAKKDIPYLTYGTDETADLTQAFPTETAETDTTTQVNTQLFEGLVRYKQAIKVVPLLATTWSNPD